MAKQTKKAVLRAILTLHPIHKTILIVISFLVLFGIALGSDYESMPSTPQPSELIENPFQYITSGGNYVTDYVDAISNEHDPADIGTHSSFAEEQDKDGVYDTLTEADVGGTPVNFGYETSTTTYFALGANFLLGTSYTSPADSGTVSTIKAYGYGYVVAQNVKAAIVLASTKVIIANGVSGATSWSTSAGWKTMTFSTPPTVASGTAYYLMLIAAGSIRWSYTTTAATTLYDTTNSYTTPTDPTDGGSPANQKFSIYATVTPPNYRTDLEVKWTSADYDEANEYLCVYGGTQDAEALKVDVWNSGTSAYVNVIADLAAGWNNVSVASYLIDATLEIRFLDGTTSSDTAQGTWQVEGVLLWCYTPNAAPINDVAPYINVVGSDVYAGKQTYDCYASVQDADGYADIDYVELSLINATDTIWTVRFDQDDHSLSEIAGGDDIILQPAPPTTYTENGINLDIKFVIFFDFSHPNNTFYLKQYVIDADASSDLDSYSGTTYDFENRLFVSGFNIYEQAVGSGTSNRGDLDAVLTAVGHIYYYGTTVGANQEYTDVYISADKYGTHSGPWSGENTVDGFAFSVYYDDEVGLITYTVKVVRNGDGFGATDLLYGGPYTDTAIADKINFTCIISDDDSFVRVGESITANIYAHYMYDNTAYSGSVTWTDDTNGTITKNTVQRVDFYVDSFTDTTHGITLFLNVSTYCVWDDIVITSGPAYYWVQYSEEAVWLIWGAPTSYAWAYNSSAIQNGIVIQSQMNGTDNAWALTSGGSIAGLVIGSFTPSWYYVNITIRTQFNGYDWIIWTEILEVDILHSLQIVSFNLIPTDYYFWIQYQSNLLNACLTIWDDMIDSGTLFADNIYHSHYEGMHQIAIDKTVGNHHYTICITSKDINPDKDFASDSYIWWYNFTNVIEADVSIYETNVVIVNNLGQVVDFSTFEIYKNGTRLYYPVTVTYSNIAYNITVKDRWGETLNSTIFANGDYEFVLVVNVYSLKVMSWYEDFVFFNITHGGLTYTEVITPLETIEFNLYTGTYTWVVDYRNGTTVGGSTGLTGSTAIIVTGSTIADIAGYSATLLAMTTQINVTVTATNNYVLTISVDLTNINTTIGSQLVYLLLNITNVNSTMYDQTVDLLAYIQNTNTTLYNQIAAFIIGVYNNQSLIYDQTVEMLLDIANLDSDIVAQTVTLLASIENVNSTIYAQTVTLLANIANLDSDIVAQTVTLLASISNVNSTIYAQTIEILSDISNVNSTLYTQTVTLLANIANLDSDIAAQTVTLLASIENVNTTIYAQTLDILADISNVNSTLYSQTLTVLTNIANMNLTLYTQAVSIMADIANTNTTIYSQLIAEMLLVDNINATIYSQVITQLLRIYNKPDNAGGDNDVVELAILNTVTYGIIGLFVFMFVIDIPAVQEVLPGGRRKTHKPSSQPPSGYPSGDRDRSSSTSGAGNKSMKEPWDYGDDRRKR